MNEETPRLPDPPAIDVGADQGEPSTTTGGQDTRIEVELDLDNYVLEWFLAQGENYEDLMNQVLQDYIATQEAAANVTGPEPDAK